MILKNTVYVQHPSNFNSLIAWGDALSQDGKIGSLHYCKGDFYTQSIDCKFDNSLIMMGKAFSITNFIKLLTLIEKNKISSFTILKPTLLAENVCVRILLKTIDSTLKKEIAEFSQATEIDFALHNRLPDITSPGLVLMDMDSTTIQIECIDEIARLYNVGEEVAKVTALAMQGKLDFNESLRTRVGKLKNAPLSILQDVADSMPIMPGLVNLIGTLKEANWKVAIASGGFNFFANRLKADYGFDYIIANDLVIEGEYLTGEVAGEIVNAEVKARTLVELAEKYQIPLSQTVAIGDGANDLLMMSAASTGIAIHAKPIVQQKADISLNYMDLEGAEIILTLATKDAW